MPILLRVQDYAAQWPLPADRDTEQGKKFDRLDACGSHDPNPLSNHWDLKPCQGVDGARTDDIILS